MARRKYEWEKTFGENFQKLQAEYENAKIIWDSKLKNAERAGKQELLLAQRNAAGEKKRLEGIIARLESRISVLEDVINNPDGSELAEQDTAEASSAISPVQIDLMAPVNYDGSASLIAGSADGSSPVASPKSCESGSLVHEDEQSPADAELSVQLRQFERSLREMQSTKFTDDVVRMFFC